MSSEENEGQDENNKNKKSEPILYSKIGYIPETSLPDLIWDLRDKENRWISDINQVITEARLELRDIYLYHAVMVNGLHLANDRYSSNEWAKSPLGFKVHAIRDKIDGSGKIEIPIAQWRGTIVSKLHLEAIPRVIKGFLIQYLMQKSHPI